MGGVFAGGPRTEDRAPVVASTPYAYSGEERTRFVGDLLSCPAGQSEHDRTLTSDVRLVGGQFWANGATIGDRVSLQVVDPSNLLGMGAGAVITTYVDRLPVPPGGQLQTVSSQTAALVSAGLVLRVVYTNTGASAVDLGVLWHWLEVPTP